MLKKSKLFVIAIAIIGAFAFTSVNAADLGSSTLRKGSTGPYVVTLQTLLGVSADGAFGPMTEAAVKAWQASHGLVADGVVGAATKAAMNAGGVTPPPASGCQAGWTVNPMTGAPCTAQLPAGCLPGYLFSPTSGAKCEAGTPTPNTNDEEADLSMDADAEDDLDNNISEQHAFTIEIEADDRGGDATVERMDLAFTITPATEDGEDDIYDIIEGITLEVDGDELDSVSTDSRSDWDDSDNVTGADYVRLSGLDLVVKSGETVEVAVLLDIGNLDVDDDLPLDIKLSNVEIRYSDGAGIVQVMDTNFFEEVSVDALDSIEFNLDENSSNPTSVTVSLNEDRDDVIVLVNDVEVDEQGGRIDEMTVTFEHDASGVSDQDDLEDLVDEVYLNGDRSDELNWLTSTTFEAVFDADEMDVDEGDEFKLEVSVDFRESAFTGTLWVDMVTFEGEGEDGEDFDKDSTPDDAPEVTLTGGALVLASSEVDKTKLTDADGEFVFTVELENEGDEDLFLSSVASATALDFDAFVFEIGGNEETGDSLPTGYTLSVEHEGDDLDGDNNVIGDGDKEEYVITVTVDAVEVNVSQYYEVELSSIKYTDGSTAGELIINLDSGKLYLTKNI